jgi:hypothetical protein
MGRETRKVPAGWEHPKDAVGNYIPLSDGTQYLKDLACWEEGAKKWVEGSRTDFKGGWIALSDAEKCLSYVSRNGERPDPKDYTPQWQDNECTHLMMYRGEGTPISPAFETAKELACWLADNNASWFGGKGASYEVWLSIIDNSAESLPIFPTGD